MPGSAADRARLLAALTRLLDEDGRVVAAWLRGSLGRGDEDDVSDIDLHVATEDGALADFDGLLALPGRPLLVQTVFSAPRGGATRCVLYAGEHGPQQVDWMLWPRSVAVLHPPARALFARSPITVAASERYETLIDQPAGDAGPGHGEATCWLFALIAARYLTRRWDSAVLAMLQGSARAAGLATGGTAALPAVPAEAEVGAGVLQAWAAALRAAVPGSRRAGDFASPEAVEGICRFIEGVAAAGGAHAI
jgi:hypothetical protein